jgi:hypothetical protein
MNGNTRKCGNHSDIAEDEDVDEMLFVIVATGQFKRETICMKQHRLHAGRHLDVSRLPSFRTVHLPVAGSQAPGPWHPTGASHGLSSYCNTAAGMRLQNLCEQQKAVQLANCCPATKHARRRAQARGPFKQARGDVMSV